MSESLDLVRSIYAAWERGDFFNRDEWAHPEIELEEPDGPEPGRVKGIQALKDDVRRFLNTWVDWQIEAEAYRELDDERVLVLSRVSGRGDASKLRVGQARAALFQVQGGKVVRYVTWWDRARAFADLGLAE